METTKLTPDSSAGCCIAKPVELNGFTVVVTATKNFRMCIVKLPTKKYHK